MRLKKLVLVAATLISVGSVLAVSGASAGGAQGLDDRAPRQMGSGAWSYTVAKKDDGSLSARVQYDKTSVSGLRQYADANRGLADSLALAGGQVPVQLTLRAPMALSDFRAWAAARTLTLQTTEVRTIDTKGRPSTIGLFASSALSGNISQSALDRQLASAQRAAGPLVVKGTYYTRAVVDASHLPGLAPDQHVFVADLSTAAVRADLRAKGIVRADDADVVAEPPFWAMEKLGLQNFSYR
jgi:hypothetical protein